MFLAQAKHTLWEHGSRMGSLKKDPQTGHFNSSSIATVCFGGPAGRILRERAPAPTEVDSSQCESAHAHKWAEFKRLEF